MPSGLYRLLLDTRMAVVDPKRTLALLETGHWSRLIYYYMGKPERSQRETNAN